MALFSSDRLLFTPWQNRDLELANTLWGDPAVMEKVDTRDHFSRAQVQRRLESEIRCAEAHGVQYWKLISREDGRFIGASGLRPWSYSPVEQPTYELGFHLMRREWGQGYATEAATRVIAYAFGDLAQTELLAGHHPENLASRKVLLNVGFKPIAPVFYPPTAQHHPAYSLKKVSLR